MNNWKSKIPAIFAEQGETFEIPIDSQTDSQVSFETGYTANYERDSVDELGNPLVQYGIERTKFNYLMKVITSALKEIQTVIPTAEISGTDKIDISSIVTETNAFDVLESILCINTDTGKASRITKEDIINNLNPNIDLSNSNISISQLASTAMDNFLAIDGDIVKKADKLLQDVIEEINLSATNVTVSNSITSDTVDNILVTDVDGKVVKTNTIPQEKIEEINLSKDNIAVDEYIDQEPNSVFKPLIASDTGTVYQKDKLPKEMIESVKFDQIEDDVYAKSINFTVMTPDTYPDGLNNLIQTGLYHVIAHDELKDIFNTQIDTTAKEEYILSVINEILLHLEDKQPFSTITELVAYAGTDIIEPYSPIIQVMGISSGETDDINVTQVFTLNGRVLGQRTFKVTTQGIEEDNWQQNFDNIKVPLNTIIEEFIDFFYDGDLNNPNLQTDLNLLDRFKIPTYNSNGDYVYGISLFGQVYPNVITVDTDVETTDLTSDVDPEVYSRVFRYNSKLLDPSTDTVIIKQNKREKTEIGQLLYGNSVILVKDRTLNIKYMIFADEVLETGRVADELNLEGPYFQPLFGYLVLSYMYIIACNKSKNYISNTIYLRNVTKHIYTVASGLKANIVNSPEIKGGVFRTVRMPPLDANTFKNGYTFEYDVDGAKTALGFFSRPDLTGVSFYIGDQEFIRFENGCLTVHNPSTNLQYKSIAPADNTTYLMTNRKDTGRVVSEVYTANFPETLYTMRVGTGSDSNNVKRAYTSYLLENPDNPDTCLSKIEHNADSHSFTGTSSFQNLTTTNGYGLYNSMVSTGNGAGNLTNWSHIMLVNPDNNQMGYMTKEQFLGSMDTWTSPTIIFNIGYTVTNGLVFAFELTPYYNLYSVYQGVYLPIFSYGSQTGDDCMLYGSYWNGSTIVAINGVNSGYTLPFAIFGSKRDRYNY